MVSCLIKESQPVKPVKIQEKKDIDRCCIELINLTFLVCRLNSCTVLLCYSGLVFMKGLSQVLGLNLLHLYRMFKPKTFCEYGPWSIDSRQVINALIYVYTVYIIS